MYVRIHTYTFLLLPLGHLHIEHCYLKTHSRVSHQFFSRASQSLCQHYSTHSYQVGSLTLVKIGLVNQLTKRLLRVRSHLLRGQTFLFQTIDYHICCFVSRLHG